MAAAKKPFPMPTGYFGIPLGLGALSLAWSHAADVYPQPAAWFGTAAGVLSVGSWALFALMFAYKWLAYREQLLDEWRCPVRFSYIALVAISTIIVGEVLRRWTGWGEALIWAGVAGQLVYSSIRIGSLWQGDVFTEKSVQPPFYLPAVAANYTSTGAMVVLGHHDFGWMFWGAGTLAWIMFEPLLLQRMRLFRLEKDQRPAIGIVLAPAFVGAAAYLALTGGQVDNVVKILVGYGFLQLFYLLHLLPWILEYGFAVGHWSFSFGAASMAAVALAMRAQTAYPLFWTGVFWFANALIALLVLMTALRIAQGRFWVKAA